jgi:hypothetical protein
MKANTVSTNHTELTGKTKSGLYYEVCFSYGRCADIRSNGKDYVNASVWKYSTSTSRHINSTFPGLKGLDINNLPSNVLLIADDARMDAVFCDVVGV